ncbi:hypothetical protein Glove_568g1 [Diversispora epigaea]|uniref:Uncharacterized protein n=1 Tax=Diversispora epigaea TaxID=1348612 RepID=A0A397GEB5_9GLOM|nr:hypothetical protein Glove_568g1 [Diversispora epigaea]
MITQVRKEQAELLAGIIKLEQNSMVLEKDKKHRKFQTKCIQITKEILSEEPIIEARCLLSKIANHIRGARESTSASVWYDEKPEIVIPQRIQKIKEFINRF